MSTRESRIAARQQQAEAAARPVLRGPVRKWEKKWVQLGHMKVFKWVPGLLSCHSFCSGLADSLHSYTEVYILSRNFQSLYCCAYM